MNIESFLKTEPLGRPHMQCAKCRMLVVWPNDLSAQEKAIFAAIVRDDPLQGMKFAKTQFGLGEREAKVLVLHITPEPGVCRKCQKSVSAQESICSCRSVCLDW
jgi:hypothetical protein